MAGKQKKIQFDFNTQEDSADEVAADLVEELMENQASALLPQTSEEREVFVSDVKKLFTSSIEDAGVCLLTLSCRAAVVPSYVPHVVSVAHLLVSLPSALSGKSGACSS